MRVAILHAEVPPDAPKDEQDVLQQVESVTAALQKLGHTPFAVPVTLDLKKAITQLQNQKPTLVFNLVESLAGVGRYIHFIPAVLDQLKLPYTGARTDAVFVTTNKMLTKSLLKSAGLKTPDWSSAQDVRTKTIHFQPPYIIKPISEDASVGLDEEAIVTNKNLLHKTLEDRINLFGDCFVEAFVPGREFNLSILAGKDGPEVLPPAEIVFLDYPKEKPRILGYRAKWDEDSFEYKKTVRNFEFTATDSVLIKEMCEIARQCWSLFDLHGYARMDFRVNENQTPLILEVNINPCISPDSGFVAAAERAHLAFEQVIERIINDC